MDHVKEIPKMIAEASKLERPGIWVDIEDKLEHLYRKLVYRRLEPDEQKKLKVAIVGLLGHSDSGVVETMLFLCFSL